MPGSNAPRGPSTILRRVFPALLLATILLLPSPSWSHPRASTSSLTGSIKTVAGGIEVSLTNNGTDAFNWFLIQMPPSVHHTGATMDAGGCGPGPDASTVRCGIASPGFVPGASHVVMIKTDGPYPPNGGAQLFTGAIFSGPYSPAGTATGPEPPPPPPAQPCKCASLIARIVPASVKLEHPTKPVMTLHFTVHWLLSCSKGTGGCTGAVDLIAPLKAKNPKTGDEGYDSKFVVGGRDRVLVEIRCQGACAKVIDGGKAVTLSAKSGLGPLDRAFESIPIKIERFCQRTLVTKLSIAFDRNGDVNLSRSKLA